MCALMRASSFIVVCCPMLQVCSLNVLFVNTTIRSLNVFCCKYHYTIIGSLCLKVQKQPSLRCVRTDYGWIYIYVNTGCVLSHVAANKPVQCSTQPVSVSSYKKQKSCSVPKVTCAQREKLSFSFNAISTMSTFHEYKKRCIFCLCQVVMTETSSAHAILVTVKFSI